MTSAAKVCSDCGAEMIGYAALRSCPACLLETGLDLLGENIDAVTDEVRTLPDVGVRSVQMLRGFGDYELQEEIGRGEQGVVYRARQKSLNRTVAVKIIALGQWANKAQLKRFRIEAEAAANLDDPHLVPIYEIGKCAGACFFSMKLVDGTRLEDVITGELMAVRQAAQLVAKLARALDCAHEHGVLHCDVKPGNILIDRRGEPHLTDFGLARLVQAEGTTIRTCEVLGTPSYMAPEQASGDVAKLSSATDVYGLGGVLYHLLTGHPPFVGDTVYETVQLLLESEPLQPRLRNPKVDRDLAAICLKCVAKDPRRRYTSALALAEDLERWLRREPIRARRIDVITRGQKWLRRNPTSTALAASLVVFAATVGGMLSHKQDVPPSPTGIAVLPFENLSADPSAAFFTEGIHSEIVSRLAKLAKLKVISRTSVMHYKSRAERNLRQIANELGVAYVVEGSVQRSANHVRVSARLIDATKDSHLWAEDYDRSLEDVFAIETEIAKAIVGRLQAKLSPVEKSAIERPPTTNLIAYDRYLRSKKLWAVQSAREPGDMAEVTRLLDQAVAHDPTFLLAYCELARAHAYMFFLGIDRTPTRRMRALAARDAALRLGPDRGESHLAAAWVAYHCYLDYDIALSEIAIAGRRLPNDAFIFALPGYIARRQGQWKRSAADLERAANVDPQSMFLFQGAAHTYQYQRRFLKAAQVLDRGLAIMPDDPVMRVWRAQIELEARADPQPAHEAVQNILTENPGAVDAISEQWLYLALCQRNAAEMRRALASLPPEGIIRRDVRMPRSFFTGLAARAQNDLPGAETAFTAARAEMEKIVRDHPDYAQAFCTLGMSDAALGHKKEAVLEGRRAVELLPITKDAWTGAEMLTNLAIIYAWVGNNELAIKQLEELVQIPSPISYGQLRLHPFWDPLRGDARFERIVEKSKDQVALQ